MSSLRGLTAGWLGAGVVVDHGDGYYNRKRVQKPGFCEKPGFCVRDYV